MKSKGSLYQKIKKLFIFSILGTSLLLNYCKRDEIWGIPRQIIAEKVKKGDFTFLKALIISRELLPEILDYGPGAAYYFALMSAHAGNELLYKNLLELEWEKGSDPWKHPAAEELIAYFHKREKYDKAIALAESYIKAYPESEYTQKIKKLLLQSLYWDKRDEEVLEKIVFYYSEKNHDLINTDPELLLFKAVSSYRLKKKGWEDLFILLFYNVRSTNLHYRAYIYLINEKERINAFKDYERDFFKAKSFHADKKYTESIPLYKKAIRKIKPGELNAGIFYDYGLACIRGQAGTEDADFIARLLPKLNKNLQATALETAGRIYSSVKSYGKAVSYLTKAYGAARFPVQKKRILWHLLRTVINSENIDTLQTITEYAPHFDDP